jgi:hypothetical protein
MTSVPKLLALAALALTAWVLVPGSADATHSKPAVSKQQKAPTATWVFLLESIGCPKTTLCDSRSNPPGTRALVRRNGLPYAQLHVRTSHPWKVTVTLPARYTIEVWSKTGGLFAHVTWQLPPITAGASAIARLGTEAVIAPIRR